MKSLYLNTASISAILFSSMIYATPVNVNSATAEEISKSLLGIGDKKAQAIVDHRAINGPFESIDSLTSVKGIGEKTIKKNAEDIRL